MQYGFLILALASLCGACAVNNNNRQSGPEPVTVGQWCEVVGEATCRNTGDKCFDGMSGFEEGCLDSFVRECAGGRDSAASQRTYDDLNACVDYVDSRSCSELGQDTGQAMVGTGSFAQLCKL